MTSSASLNGNLNDWLAALAGGSKAALQHGARRFAALVSPHSPLELPPTSPQTADCLGATLSIVAGLHQGASLELTEPGYLIGSGEDCDVVLCDPKVASHHCRLSREWSGFVVRDLRSSTTPVVTPKSMRYQSGTIEVEYDVGGVSFVVRQVPPRLAVSTGKNQELPRVIPAVVLATIVVGIALAVATLAAGGRLAKPAIGSVAGRASADSEALTPLTDVVEQSRRALADPDVRVRLYGGRLYVEGKTSQQAVKARLRALTEDLRGVIAVEDHVNYLDPAALAAPGPLPVQVRSVMIGAPSYFLTDTGSRYFVGGVLPDGAEVLAIEAGEIRFRRGERVFGYKLQ